MFREVADIQTADMLKLPVPKVNYHNIKTKPSEIQTEMVAVEKSMDWLEKTVQVKRHFLK